MIPPFIRSGLRTMQRAFEQDDYRSLGMINEALQPVADAAVRRIMGLKREITRLKGTADPGITVDRLLELRETAERLEKHTDGSAQVDSFQVDAWVHELLSSFLDVLDEALSAEVHRELNRKVAGALGLLHMRFDPEIGKEVQPSWHDMPERVTALMEEVAALRGEAPTWRDGPLPKTEPNKPFYVWREGHRWPVSIMFVESTRYEPAGMYWAPLVGEYRYAPWGEARWAPIPMPIE